MLRQCHNQLDHERRYDIIMSILVYEYVRQVTNVKVSGLLQEDNRVFKRFKYNNASAEFLLREAYEAL